MRGICCLVPGVPGVSETIEVVSVVGRFLEHSRIYSFHRGDEHVYYIGSADLMPRNLDTRVELLTPVDAPELKAELQDTLDRCLADDTYAWTLDADGDWTRRDRPHPLGPPGADGAHARARPPRSPTPEPRHVQRPPADRETVQRVAAIAVVPGRDGSYSAAFGALAGRLPSVTLICLVWPSRLTVSVIVWPGLYRITVAMKPSVVVIVVPLTAVIRSPGCEAGLGGRRVGHDRALAVGA